MYAQNAPTGTPLITVTGPRLRILCILDLSRKTSPVGVPENYLCTLDPPTTASQIVDLDTGVVLRVVDGRGSAGLKAWLTARSATQLCGMQVVAIDPGATLPLVSESMIIWRVLVAGGESKTG